MAALLPQLPVVQDQDTVCSVHRGETVCDDQAGAPLEQFVGGTLDLGFDLRVHGASGFVEHKNGRIERERAGERDQLALAHRE